MLFQEETFNVPFTVFLVIMSIIGLCLCFFFFILPLIYKKIKRTKEKEENRAAFYFSFSNLMIALMQIPLLIGLFDSLGAQENTYVYNAGITFALLLEVISALFLFLFTNETFNYNNRIKYFVFSIGGISIVLLTIFAGILLQTQSQSPLHFMGLGFTALYLITVYFLMAQKFYNLYKKLDQKLAKIKAIFIGSVLMVVFVVLLSIAGPFSAILFGKVLMVIGFAVLLIAVSWFFYGFILH